MRLVTPWEIAIKKDADALRFCVTLLDDICFELKTKFNSKDNHLEIRVNHELKPDTEFFLKKELEIAGWDFHVSSKSKKKTTIIISASENSLRKK